nr:molybdenum ABC transporter ATP-binding protein [uncultured Celeribacter sp.]
MTLHVDLAHHFGGFTLQARFEAPSGITVLFGPSGSGKTTVVRAVGGGLTPDQGRISVGERVLCDTARGICLRPHKRRIGTVFQEARLFPHLSVLQNLNYGRRLSKYDVPQKAFDQMIDMLGIGHLLTRRPAGLSGGEQQRVAIGRALLSGPDLILADEPLAALDGARKAEILPYFERLRDEVDVPILYVSHSPSEVARLATTVIALEEGRVIGQGSAREILGDPEVLPLGATGAGAVIEAVVARHHDDGLTELHAGDAPVFLPRLALDPGERVRLRIAAQDVMLARSRPEGLSALNLLPGTVAAVHEGGGAGVIVALDTVAGRVLARITKRSVAALGLTVGMPCHAVVKTISLAGEGPGVLSSGLKPPR